MNRREFLKATLALSSAAGTSSAWAQGGVAPLGLADGTPFSRDALYEYARALASRPFERPPTAPGAPYDQLNAEQYRQIRPRPDRALWAGEGRGFAIDLLPGGWVFRVPVAISVIEDGRVRRLASDASLFDYGTLPVPAADFAFPFSGFAVKAAIDRPDTMRECAVFQGASRFRALARGQIFGVAARGITIEPGASGGEDFFRAFWIERPPPGGTTLTIYALLESERLAGACRITLRPGEITVTDVEMTLFPRVPLDNVGFAPMTSMYLFGSNDRRGVDDVRLAAHRSDGLQMWTGAGEWLWRPVNNPEQLQISAFVDRNPRGFGLLQRTRDFGQYGDLEQRYDRMPSLWVEPLGDWGPGQVGLLEIPTDSEVNENIMAFWRPQGGLRPDAPASLAYRLNWCWLPPDRPSGATVAATRVGRGGGGRRRRFLVDFVGEPVADPSRIGEIRPVLTAAPGAITDVLVRPNPEIKGVRVSFELDPGNEPLSELRMLLQADGKPVSETWLYRWTP